MVSQNNNYVIGVDGGGTKTIAALADLSGKILKIGKSGSSNPRNVGIKMAIENIVKAVSHILPKNKKTKIVSIFIGLPAVEEEFKPKTKEIQKGILRPRRSRFATLRGRQKGISRILKGEIVIGSDQLVAFRAGTDKKEGIVLITGTGCVAHGWNGEKEHKVSGWGWLTDEGSAFWIGQKVLQAVFKDLDGRGPKTLLTDFTFQQFKIRKPDPNLLNQKIYSQDLIKTVSSLSFLCNLADRKGDKMSKNILIEAGKELSLSVKAVIKELNFLKEAFPLVLVGSMLKSKIVLDTIKMEVKKIAPKVEFIIPKKEPVVGAVKLAIEKLKP